MGKIKLFDPLQEVRAFPFPWDSSIVFSIRRSGKGELAKRKQARGRALAVSALGRMVGKDGGKALGSLGDAVTPSTLAENVDPSVLAELIADQLLPEHDIEGIVGLVDRVSGLRDADSGEPIEWTREVGMALLTEYADLLPPWIEQCANQIEADFQKYLEEARGNSVPSSASSSAAVDGATLS